jgi:hypothetical protein
MIIINKKWVISSKIKSVSFAMVWWMLFDLKVLLSRGYKSRIIYLSGSGNIYNPWTLFFFGVKGLKNRFLLSLLIRYKYFFTEH